MEISLFLIVLLAELVALTLAAFFSHGIYKHNRLNKPWSILTFAIWLMVLKVLAQIFGELSQNLEIISSIQLLDNMFLELLIALSLFWALANMKSEFDNFEVIEKKSKKIAKKVRK